MDDPQTASDAKQPLDREEATAKAKLIVAAKKPEHDFVLQEEKTLERAFGWVFFYAPRKYLETKNPKLLMPGTGPFIIEKTGEVTFLGTSRPPGLSIEAFEKRWRETQAKPRTNK